jgi:hypothetical protein
MKRIYLALLFLGIYSLVKAQPQINRSNYPVVGDNYAALANFFADWTPGTDGAGQTWDFSTMTGFGNYTFAYSEPSTVPTYGPTFAASDIALNPLIGQYSFFLSSGTKFEISGTVTQFTTITVRPYTDPQTIITFPFTYGDEFKDTAETGNYSFGSGTDHQQRTIYSKTKGDAYGNITLPGGTVYNNVLRIRITSETIDSNFNSSNVFLSKDISIDTNYYWISPDLKPHVFVLTKSVQDPTGSPTTNIIAQYFSAPTTETGIFDAYNSYFSIYPNPISTELNIKVDEGIFRNNPDLTISIINAEATEVMKSSMESEHTIVRRNQLASGIYFYTIKSQDKILSSGKLIFK